MRGLAILPIAIAHVTPETSTTRALGQTLCAGIHRATRVCGSSTLAIDLRAGYMHLRNDSSDPAERYTSNAIRVGVGLRF